MLKATRGGDACWTKMAEENVIETTQAEECIDNPSMEIDENIIDNGGIDYIPDEILEYILKLVSPYQDFRSCSRYVLTAIVFEIQA